MSQLFLVVDYEGNSAEGDSPQDAFDSLEDSIGEIAFDDCTFYIATPIEVERKITTVEKTTITRTTKTTK